MENKKKIKKKIRVYEKDNKYNRIIAKIRDCLSPNLLKPQYKLQEADYEIITSGHCYVATEAAYYTFAREKGYVPYVLRHNNGTHWYLINDKTGHVIDPTEPQLGGKAFKYHKGHRQAFLTKKASKRTKELLRRMQYPNK